MGVKRADVKEKVIEIIKEALCPYEPVILTDNLRDNLDMDSLDGVELILCLENEFGIEIPDEDAENIKTVNDVVEFLEKNIQQGE